MKTFLNITYLPADTRAALVDLCIYRKRDRIVEPFAGNGIFSYLFDADRAFLNDPVQANLTQISTVKNNPAAVQMSISQIKEDVSNYPMYIDPVKSVAFEVYIEAREFNDSESLNAKVDSFSTFLNKPQVYIEDNSPMDTLKSLRKKDMVMMRCAETNEILFSIIKDAKSLCVILAEKELAVEGFNRLQLTDTTSIYYNF